VLNIQILSFNGRFNRGFMTDFFIDTFRTEKGKLKVLCLIVQVLLRMGHPTHSHSQNVACGHSVTLPAETFEIRKCIFTLYLAKPR
jgi:hypothetical protein